MLFLARKENLEKYIVIILLKPGRNISEFILTKIYQE